MIGGRGLEAKGTVEVWDSPEHPGGWFINPDIQVKHHNQDILNSSLGNVVPFFHSFVGCGEEGPIRSIFFADFHPTLGSRIRYQAPANPSNRKDHVDKDFFAAISNYLIPKPELARRHLTLNVNGKKLCAYCIIMPTTLLQNQHACLYL